MESNCHTLGTLHSHADPVLEVLEPEGPQGTPMFHVEHWPGFHDLWLYRTDAGDLRATSAVRGLTPERVAPLEQAIALALEPVSAQAGKDAA